MEATLVITTDKDFEFKWIWGKQEVSGNSTVLVSCDCYSKLAQTWLLKTIEINSVEFWSPEVWNQYCWTENKVLAQLHSLQRFQWKIHSLSLPASSSCQHFLTCDHRLPSSKLASWNLSLLCSHITLSSVYVKSPSASLL